ncbi:MAG: SIS domain-containing protein [Thermotogae bacterium]|nr:SIS domain-containing protein [Thermotogota bacterium]
MSLIEEYLNKIVKRLEDVHKNEGENIAKAASLITKAILEKKHIYIFGCTHSSILAEEVFYRAGSLAEYEPLFVPGLSVTNTKPVLTSLMEKNEQFGKDIVSCSRIEKDDVLIVISTSGRNAVPVEVALEAKEKGLKLIVITSRFYKEFPSNHSSGKKLTDVGADVVINNHVDIGDAVVKVGDNYMGPISTILGAFILHSISIKVAQKLLETGKDPNVFASANVPKNSEKNKKILEDEFLRRILLMP